MKLSEAEKSRINKRVESLEACTGVQVLAAVSGKCDAYPEVPWKAFSLGAALAALALTSAAPLAPAVTALPLFLWAIVVLGAGLALALAAVFLRPAARLFVGAERAEAETRQFALAFYLERGLDRTRERKALLVLVSQFERRAAVVADTGVRERIPHAELKAISAVMNTALAHGSASAALIKGLSVLEELLRSRGFKSRGSAGDEIPEELLETEGPNP